MKTSLKHILAASLSLLLTLAFASGPLSATTGHYDLIIANGQVFEGSERPAVTLDIGITGDRIARLGDLSQASAERVIDASGKHVMPGFIDMHSHAGGTVLSGSNDQRRTAPNLIAQGITTVVINQDGRSRWPIGEQREAIENADHGPNAILLIGHGTVRREVMGSDFRRPATAEEIERMRLKTRQGMEEGAWGISAGLEYVPGRWSETGEVIAMVGEIVPYQGVLISHQRSEGGSPMWYWPSQHDEEPVDLLTAIAETIEIGETTGATVVASHIKAKGVDHFGKSRDAIRLINEARDRGVRIYADQYTYNTSGTDGNVRLIPAWARDRGRRLLGNSDASITEAVNRLLQDEELAAKLKLDIQHEIDRRGGADSLVIMRSHDDSHLGRTLAEIAAERGVSPLEMVFIFQQEGNHAWRGGVRKRGFSFSEEDVEAFMQQEWTATCSDAGVRTPGQSGSPHARFFGTYPRKFRHYVLDRGAITVEHAVRTSTSLPAEILNLAERGLVREGYFADLVVIDMENIRDLATFEEPQQYPEGVDYVLVNGVPVVDDGEITWQRPGRVLTPLRDATPR